VRIYFSDFFAVPPAEVEAYGAFDISLVNDLPLFIDPFLLFSSDDPKYQALHADIIRYMRFLKDMSADGSITKPLIEAWFTFREVKQNWLGFSLKGNRGHGLGMDFARALHRNLNTVFRDFGEETITKSSHLEKLCLIRDGVGRDNISDFTTNLIKDFLCEYTQTFAQHHVSPTLRAVVSVPKAVFSYETRRWLPKNYDLPQHDGDFVLLTPRDILTKDDTWINRPELIGRVNQIADALPDSVLRAQVNEYLARVLPAEPNPRTEDVRAAYAKVIDRFPQIIDFYVRDKEDTGYQATNLSRARVSEVDRRFVKQVRTLVNDFLEPAGFYDLPQNTYEEARARILFLKDVVENKGGHRIFYLDGKPIEREADLQILYRLTWFGSPSDVSREVDDGRGPADYKISRGASDKTIIEFKLAKNTQLERNLENQTRVYEAASDPTHPSIKAILFFSTKQLLRVQRILKRLELTGDPNIILIDARSENKPSGSRA
jgi:hypothetical protein